MRKNQVRLVGHNVSIARACRDPVSGACLDLIPHGILLLQKLVTLLLLCTVLHRLDVHGFLEKHLPMHLVKIGQMSVPYGT